MHCHVLRRLRYCPRGDKSNFGPSSFGLNFQWKSTIVLRVQISHLFGSIWFFFSYFARRFSTWLTQTCTLIYTKSLGGWVWVQGVTHLWRVRKGEAWLNSRASYLSTAQKNNLGQQLIFPGEPLWGSGVVYNYPVSTTSSEGHVFNGISLFERDASLMLIMRAIFAPFHLVSNRAFP